MCARARVRLGEGMHMRAYVCPSVRPRARACVCVCVGVCVQQRDRVFALEWAHLSCMPRAGDILPTASLDPSYFSTLSHNRHDFRKKVTECKMCFSILSTTFI